MLLFRPGVAGAAYKVVLGQVDAITFFQFHMARRENKHSTSVLGQAVPWYAMEEHVTS
jgi:hypothetical protein